MKTAFAKLFHQTCIGEICFMKSGLAKCENYIQEETSWMKLYSWELQGRKTCMAKTALVKYEIHKNYICEMRVYSEGIMSLLLQFTHICLRNSVCSQVIISTFVCIVIRNTSPITNNHKNLYHQFVMKIEEVQLR
jgi:hypothetical protein